MKKYTIGIVSLALLLSASIAFGADPSVTSPAPQTKAQALGQARQTYAAALKTARADSLSATKTARETYAAALKTARDAMTGAKKTAVENYKAALEKAKADNSADERKTALDAYRAAVKNVNSSYVTARKEAYAALKTALKSAQDAYAAAHKTALDALNAEKASIQTQFPDASKAPAIVGVALGTSLAANGGALHPSKTFSSGTQSIYAVLSLKNTTRRTELSYIRYYNGKYVDSRVSHPSKNGEARFHFQWTLKAGKAFKPGSYQLAFYVDGKKSRTISYTMQ